MSADQETRERDHARPDGGVDPDSLWDPAVRVPTHAERARTLTAGEKSGALSTLAQDPAGYPYGSLVTFALFEGEPLFLISALAEHTKNLSADPRASLLVTEAGRDNPLALGRLTLVGEGARVEDPGERAAAMAAMLAVHPNAAGYADYRDFSFWRLSVRSVRYIGGFGRMSWLAREAWLTAEPDPLAPHAAGIVRHMNEDHGDALVRACRAFTRATAASVVRMTGIDQYGFDLAVDMPNGERPARIAFESPVTTLDEARKAMVRIAKEARARLEGGS